MKQILQTITLGILFLFSATTVHAQYVIKIAGNDSAGYYGDGGLALQASLYSPQAICSDAAGNLYIGDGALTASRCFRVRKIDAASGIITTIAGSVCPYIPPSADSADVIAATAARFNFIRALCIDRQGNLLIADGGKRVRKLNLSTDIVTTVAGNPLTSGYAGDGGPATAASLDGTFDVAVDKANNIYSRLVEPCCTKSRWRDRHYNHCSW